MRGFWFQSSLKKWPAQKILWTRPISLWQCWANNKFPAYTKTSRMWMFCWLVPWRCWVFQMFWWDCNHNRRVIEAQMFRRWKRSNPNNPSTRHVRFRFLDDNWKYQMPVWMEDLDKAIAKVIVLFDGEEEISTELRESIVNNVQRKDILASRLHSFFFIRIYFIRMSRLKFAKF